MHFTLFLSMNSTKDILNFLIQAYQFEVMPNAYLDAMRVFTKNSKAIFFLVLKRKAIHQLYVHDSLLAGDTYKDCLHNIHEKKVLLEGSVFTHTSNYIS